MRWGVGAAYGRLLNVMGCRRSLRAIACRQLRNALNRCRSFPAVGGGDGLLQKQPHLSGDLLRGAFDGV